MTHNGTTARYACAPEVSFREGRPIHPSIHFEHGHRLALLELPRGRSLDLAALKALIVRSGVHHGIHRETLLAATLAADQDRSLVLADARLLHAPLRGHFAETLSERAVLTGERLGRFLLSTDGPLTLGAGLRFGVDGLVEATRRGQLSLAGGVAQVVMTVHERVLTQPVVQVADDGAAAWLDLAPGESVTAGALTDALVRARIGHGLDHHAADDATTATDAARRIVLAHATTVVFPGEAAVSHLIDDGPHLETLERIDFHELHRFPEVAAGTALVRVTLPTPGRDGCDVLGKVRRAPAPRPLDPARFIGDGAVLSPDDPTLVIAERTGAYQRLPTGKVTVVEAIAIAGDLDLHVGNLATRFPITIRGDVKGGFVLKSAANIEVNGVIEDARISVHGDLTVRGGILPGQQRVKARGAISARHVQDRELKCRDLMVNGPLLLARVHATGTVTAKSIIGGDIIAAGGIVCGDLGEVSGLRTIVQVGIDPWARAQLAQARAGLTADERLLPELKERCRITAHQIERLPPDDAQRPVLSTMLDQQLGDYATACQRHVARVELLADAKRLEEVDETRVANVTIAVSGTVFPGVEIRFGERYQLSVTSPLTRVTFRLAPSENASALRGIRW